MICNICLSEDLKGAGEVDRLHLCKDCLNKVKKYWDDSDVKEY